LALDGLGQYGLLTTTLISPCSAILTDADLEKIGVSLGHRRKILTAIAERASASPLKHEPAGGVEPKPREAAFVASCQTLSHR
jgi:hypothetical protein